MSEKGTEREDLSLLTPSERAQRDLNEVMGTPPSVGEVVALSEDFKDEKTQSNVGLSDEKHARARDQIAVGEELHAGSVLEQHSLRQHARLLIITKSLSAGKNHEAMEKRLAELAGLFPEVHVIALTLKSDGFKNVERTAPNVWIYPTHSGLWLEAVFQAFRIAKKQLTFGDGFRADIIIADDPFESGVVGRFLAKKYGRPLQVYISEDHFDERLRETESLYDLRLLLAKYVLSRADCVRVISDQFKGNLLQKFPRLKDCLEVLPVYYDLEAWRNAEVVTDLRVAHPEFKLILLHVSSMDDLSNTELVIAAAGRILSRYSSIGLMVLGNGPRYDTLVKLVDELGLSDQVVFLGGLVDTISAMKSANLLIHVPYSDGEEGTILKAAAVGLPMVLGARGIVKELFTDHETALICESGDLECVMEKINTFLNNNQLRVELARNAEEMVFERIHQDYSAYLLAYQDSIERCLAAGS